MKEKMEREGKYEKGMKIKREKPEGKEGTGTGKDFPWPLHAIQPHANRGNYVIAGIYSFSCIRALS